MTIDAVSSGKTHRDENFPVASWLVAARHRPAIMAFYRFARAADDIADSSVLDPAEKLRRLDAMGATLDGGAAAADAVPLRAVLAERDLPAVHARDLLAAFRLDVTKTRYRDWQDLMDYCALSAMPVGRFVLDVHGEARSTWPASDALCAALQVINHLQDCGKDRAALDRVYLPLDTLVAHGAAVADLDAKRAKPELRLAIADLARRTSELLESSAPFARQIADKRLGCEVAVIQRLAETLCARLERRDPLSERVHLSKAGVAVRTASAAAAALLVRMRSGTRPPQLRGARP